MPEPRRRKRRSEDPENDSLWLVLRDLVFLGIKATVVIGAVLWLAELPAAQRLPGATWLPKLSHLPGLNQIPTAAHVFHVKLPPAPVATARPAATAHPVAVLTATPAPATPAAEPTPPAQAVAAPAITPTPAGPLRTGSGGVRHASKAVNGIPVQVVTIDLSDPNVVATVSLAKNAARPNIAGLTVGDEPFQALVKRASAAAVINGTFFSKDAEKRVMGNMVRDGGTIKFSQWEKGGTTFALAAGNVPRMMTDGVDLDPKVWDRSWLAVTAGPRLLRNGVTWCKPTEEGFHDPHVLGSAGRSALGYDAAGHKLLLVSFDANVALNKAAEIMRALGCSEAMNLDGGASRALAVGGQIIVPAGRPLTNVLVVYDKKFPAPSALKRASDAYRPEE